MGNIKPSWTWQPWIWPFSILAIIATPALGVVAAVLTLVLTGSSHFWEEPMFLVGMVLVAVGIPSIFKAFYPKELMDLLECEVRMPVWLVSATTRDLLAERWVLLEGEAKWPGWQDVTLFASDDTMYQVGFLDGSYFTRVRIHPRPPRDAFEALRGELEERWRKTDERDRRLREPPMEAVREPVVAARSFRRWGGLIQWLLFASFIYVTTALFVSGLVLQWTERTTFDRLFMAVVCAAMLSFSGFLAWVLYELALSKLADRVEVRADRVRSRRGDRVLNEFMFGPDVGVDMRGDDLDTVTGYYFGKGRRDIVFHAEDGYDKVKMRKMCPLVMTAVWEHEMTMGWRLRKLLRERRD